MSHLVLSFLCFGANAPELFKEGGGKKKESKERKAERKGMSSNLPFFQDASSA
jgi:hypothetical protein